MAVGIDDGQVGGVEHQAYAGGWVAWLCVLAINQSDGVVRLSQLHLTQVCCRQSIVVSGSLYH